MTTESDLATAIADIRNLKEDRESDRQEFRAFIKDDFAPVRDRVSSVNGAIGWAMGACAGLGAILGAVAGWLGHLFKP